MADISLQYLDQPLNNVSVGYQNDDYYAERLLPIAPVMKQSGRYWVYGKEKFRQYETIRHAGAEAREIAPWTLSNSAYFCDDHSLKDKISDGLNEARILVLGGQVLIGFQFRSTLEVGFDHLPRGAHYLGLAALGAHALQLDQSRHDAPGERRGARDRGGRDQPG